jgi:hypothetical protein
MRAQHPSLASAWRCAAVLNGSLAVLLVGLWVWMGVQGLFWKADFSAFYTGWSMVLDGHGDRLYDRDLQDAYQHRVVLEKPADEGLLPFISPPHLALTLAPLALLPRGLAFGVWTVFQLGLCVVAGRFLLRLQADQSASVRRLTLLTVLAFPPLFGTFQMGQLALWCLVCLLGFVCALKEQRPLTCALWVVACTIKPQLAVAPCLILLGQRRWRELALVAGQFGAWAAVTAAILGPWCWTDFLGMVRFCSQQFGAYGMNPLVMYNLKGLLTSVLGAGRADLILPLTAAAWLAGIGMTLWLWRRVGATDVDARLALTFLLAAVVNPHYNPADVLVLVLPAVLFLGHLRRQEQWGQATVFAAVAVACPLLFLLDCYLLDPSRLGFRPFFLLMLGVAGWMTVSLARADQHALPASQPA